MGSSNKPSDLRDAPDQVRRMMALLDDVGVPRAAEGGELLSLFGRVVWLLEHRDEIERKSDFEAVLGYLSVDVERKRRRG